MKHSFALLFVVTSLTSWSQTYFQQQTDYKIEVTLNDTLHSLDGFITIDYKNNSPQSLNYILFHLWANAYRDQTTPLAKQLLENGETDFYFSKPEQRGFIDHLDFKTNAEACKWDYDSASLEMAKLNLNAPLKTGESVRITTPFRVKLPETFSRLGHIGQSYQISQWYPKPAVFDKTGWHPIPYLDQGEFYSEFGSFDVSITLPKNYIVGATGDLQNEDEKKWLDSLSEATKKIVTYVDNPNQKFPASSKETKTLHYLQTNIHDFGWFADKRFRVLKGEVELPYSKKKVITWSLFTDNQAKLWCKSTEYLHDAIYNYSQWIGDYPYAQVTAVDGALSAGGGMEYPNVTVIGESRNAFELDDVITHEVGHNWFYGMLGSNERDHAWMDEGINSYYEERYIRTKYPSQKVMSGIPTGIGKAFNVNQYRHKYLYDLGYQFQARENYDQALEQTSSKFTDFNYGVMVYGKSMLIFSYLEAYLGTEVFDKAVKKYFETWRYKHPQPEDIRNVFETETGKNLSWFFDDLINTKKKVDYRIDHRQKTIDDRNTNFVSLSNIGEINSPVSVSVLKHDSILRTIWVDGFEGKKNIEVNTEGGDKVQIDPLMEIPEINRRNNTYKLNKAAHHFEKLRFQFLGSVENQNRTQVFFAPYIGGNYYDKFQIGLAFYNTLIPQRKFNYLLVPALGTGSKQFIGFGRLSYNFCPDNNMQRITVGVAGKRFSYLSEPRNLMFNKIEPYINVEFKKRDPRSPFTHSLNLRSVIAWVDWIRFDNGKKEAQKYFVNEIKYRVEGNTTRNPFNVQATLREGNSFVNLSAEANFTISYKKKNEGLSVRIFAGGFIINSKPSNDVSAPNPKFYLSNCTTNTFAYWLQKDYMLDENYLDRNGRNTILGRQIAKTDGAFRSLTTFGATNKFLTSLNITSTTHRFFPVQPFANIALVLNDLKKAELAAEVGLSLVLIKDMVEIHLPLITTKNISENQKVMGITKWYQKFTFTLKWQMQKPMQLIRRFVG